MRSHHLKKNNLSWVTGKDSYMKILDQGKIIYLIQNLDGINEEENIYKGIKKV